MCFYFSALQKLPSAPCRNSSPRLSSISAPFAQTSSAGVRWDDPTPGSPATGQGPVKVGQVGSAGIAFQGTAPCLPGWDLLCTLAPHTILDAAGQGRAGQAFGDPSAPLSSSPASAWGGNCETRHPKEPGHGKSSSGGGRFAARLIRIQWECGGSHGASQAGGGRATEQTGSPAAGPRWPLQHAECYASGVRGVTPILWRGPGD